jgi:predicted RNA-binding Zn-ribbon protein involved in translation (DUF1610 family)
MITLVLSALVIIILTAAYIAWPWLKRYLESVEIVTEDDSVRKLETLREFPENEGLVELYSQRDATYAAIEELEFDVKSGTLSDEDSNELKQSYKAKGESIIKEIDNKEKSAGQDSEIERQIMELRQGVTSFCPQCGEETRKDDKFCVQCGAELNIRRSQ